jgi:hypothetical protein
MTKFPEQVDRALGDFCEEFGLHLSTEYRDEEVRSIDVVDDQASSYQIWLEQSDSGWIVRLWNRKSRSAEFPTVSGELLGTLRSAYRELERWITEAGHTRKTVA